MSGTPKEVCRVLVIDDDLLYCEVAKAFFTKRGATAVHMAHDGRQAVSALEVHARELDLILLDLNMPNFDGVEFIGYMHATGIAIPFLIVSAADKSVLRAAEALARQYRLPLLGAMTKPLDYRKLAEMLPACS